ncbi:hypothetical protein AB6A23_13170 [Paenibacillus tarimensis]
MTQNRKEKMMNDQKSTKLRGERLQQLKKYENYCYQIVFYILENEVLALAAAKESLISLYQHPEFAAMPENFKRNTVKSTAIKYSLRMKQETYKNG